MVQAPPKPRRKVSQHPVSKREGIKPLPTPKKRPDFNVFSKSYVKIVLFIDRDVWDDLVQGKYEAEGDVILRRQPLEPAVRVEVRMKRLPKERRQTKA